VRCSATPWPTPNSATAYQIRRLSIERNKKWLGKIEGYLKEKAGCMVVVGAGHLIGRYGLIELLRSRGYSIRQL
jgi:uncharacterized protein YbaP (TraB family)